MSFWPLATSLVDTLRLAAGRGPLIELGVGDGNFAARLAPLGIPVVGIDRRRSAAACDIVADVRRLPLRDRSVAAFLSANLLRHLKPAEQEQLAAATARCAAPDATWAILEDDAAPIDAATENYHECLRLLAAVDSSRGVLLNAVECEARMRGRWRTVLQRGVERNGERVQNVELPLQWLRSRVGESDMHKERLERLAERVRRQGMSYGNYWYLLLQCA